MNESIGILDKPEVTLNNSGTSKAVELRNLKLSEIFVITDSENNKIPLTIPDYQRIYSWEEKNVIRLLDDIANYTDKVYHLGTIILYKKEIDDENENKYEIVDGQQRLVTLTLLLLELGKEVPLSNEIFFSDEAKNYIAYNKWLIHNYVENNKDIFLIENICEMIQFSVLLINGGSLDIAYTFFTNQNSKGIPLTDYDLLKAHHLRFIHIEEQAKHLASRWDTLILSSDNDDVDKHLGRTLGIYLFRLRKWMRKREWSNDQKYIVKNEFEAAPIINSIPPFGEQFYYYEAIQGGPHFFAYVEYFIHKYKEFSKSQEYKLLQNNLSNEKHFWYRDVVETILFAYFVKFGSLYITDALLGILHIISKQRYVVSRAYLKSILRYAGDTELILMIDQATSPTFFLAEMQNAIKMYSKPQELKGTRKRYFEAVENIKNQTVNTVVTYNM